MCLSAGCPLPPTSALAPALRFAQIRNKSLKVGDHIYSRTNAGCTLTFENGTVHNIRSISQRALAIAWARLAKNGLPSFDRFEPNSRIHDPKQLAVWKVEANNPERVFRALYRGNLIDEAFNEGWIGKTLAEVTPPSLQSAIISASDKMRQYRMCCLHHPEDFTMAEGFALNLERLLLPFGKDGRVQVIVASLQLISLQGTVERRSAVKSFEAQCENRAVLSVTIPAASFSMRPKGSGQGQRAG